MATPKAHPFTEYRILPEQETLALRRKMLRRLLKLRSKSVAPPPAAQPTREPDCG